MKYLFIFGICFGLTSCTLNMSMTQATDGATDVVDAEQTSEYDTKLEGHL